MAGDGLIRHHRLVIDSSRPPLPLVLGIDGGNSKADVVLADRAGRVLGARRGATISHQVVPLAVGMTRLRELVQGVLRDAGHDASQPVAKLVAALAGADYPEDVRLLTGAIERMAVADDVCIVNDTMGALRAGTSGSWGVALVCGQGINAAAIAPNGRSARFPGVGDIAGDWGGAGGVGMAGLQAAVRGDDHRGPHTSLERAVPHYFGLRRPPALVHALYLGRIASDRLSELSPVVFGEAEAGDEVARDIVDRLADELGTMAAVLMQRLRLGRRAPEVVLAGGVFRTEFAPFYQALERRIQGAAREARLVRLGWPPVAGAVLLALDRSEERSVSGAEPGAGERLRRALAGWDAKLRTADRSAAQLIQRR